MPRASAWNHVTQCRRNIAEHKSAHGLPGRSVGHHPSSMRCCGYGKITVVRNGCCLKEASPARCFTGRMRKNVFSSVKPLVLTNNPPLPPTPAVPVVRALEYPFSRLPSKSDQSIPSPPSCRRKIAKVAATRWGQNVVGRPRRKLPPTAYFPCQVYSSAVVFTGVGSIHSKDVSVDTVPPLFETVARGDDTLPCSMSNSLKGCATYYMFF